MMSIHLEKQIQNVGFGNTEFLYGCWAGLLLEGQLLSSMHSKTSITSKAQTHTLKRSNLKEEKAISPKSFPPCTCVCFSWSCRNAILSTDILVLSGAWLETQSVTSCMSAGLGFCRQEISGMTVGWGSAGSRHLCKG